MENNKNSLVYYLSIIYNILYYIFIVYLNYKMSRRIPSNCKIPVKYCGNKHSIPRHQSNERRYSKKGSRNQCLNIGYLANHYQEKRKRLPSNSLRQIIYIGEIYDNKFKRRGIRNIDVLIDTAEGLSKRELEQLLKRIFTKSNGALDKRAFNSTIMFLYKNTNISLPSCHYISDDE